MARVARRPAVAIDLEHIWYESWRRFGPDQADKVIQAVEDRFLFLAEYAGVGARRPELGKGIRSFPISRYPFVIYFVPISDGVEIIAVLHGRRTLEPSLVEG